MNAHTLSLADWPRVLFALRTRFTRFSVFCLHLLTLAVHEEKEKEARRQASCCHQEEGSCGHPGSGEIRGGGKRAEPSRGGGGVRGDVERR